jgi:hypothetical protein
MTFAPLIFFANHSVRLDKKTSTRQAVEMKLLEVLTEAKPLPNQTKQLVVTNVVSLPSSVFDATQSNQSENSITQPTFPPEVVEPKTLNLNISPKGRDSFTKSSQSPVKQLVEEESIRASKKQNEKFANDVKNSAKPDCLKNDHGLGLFNVVPLIYDIVKDKCN